MSMKMLMTEWTDGCMRDSRLRGNCADPPAGCWSFNLMGTRWRRGEKRGFVWILNFRSFPVVIMCEVWMVYVEVDFVEYDHIMVWWRWWWLRWGIQLWSWYSKGKVRLWNLVETFCISGLAYPLKFTYYRWWPWCGYDWRLYWALMVVINKITMGMMKIMMGIMGGDDDDHDDNNDD